MPKYKLLILIVMDVALLSSCNQITNKPSSINSSIFTSNSTDSQSTTNNMLQGNYKLDILENQIKEDICADFGYDEEKKECKSTLHTPKVQNINKLASINPEFDLKNNPVTSNYAGVTSVDHESKKNTNDGSSYLVLYPKLNTAGYFKGVIVYFHPTLFDKQLAPSIKTTGKSDQDYAAIFASQGYVVILPDYQGMGQDWQNIHPYVIDPDKIISNARQVLDLERSKIETDYKPVEAIPLFTIGFSEGASYSINFARGNDIPSGYNLRASIGLDGAYDLSGTTYSYLTSNVNAPDACAIENNSKFQSQYQVYVNLTKPALMSLVMPTYNKYITQKNLSYGFDSNFYNMAKCSYLTKNCIFDGQSSVINIGDALQKTSLGNEDYVEKVCSAAIGTGLYLNNSNNIKETLGYLLTSDNNSLINHNSTGNGIFNASVINEDGFKQALKKANAYNFTPKTNLMLISLKHDSVVSPINTNVAYDSFNGSYRNPQFSIGTYVVNNSDFHTNVTALLESWQQYIPNFKTCYNRLDHLSAEPFLDIVALKAIQTLDRPKNPIETDITKNPVIMLTRKCGGSYSFELTSGTATSVFFDDNRKNQCENIGLNTCSFITDFPTTPGTDASHTLKINNRSYTINYHCNK